MECLIIIGLLLETVTGAVEPWDEGGRIAPDVDWGSCGGISVLWDVGVWMVSAVVWSEYYFWSCCSRGCSGLAGRLPADLRNGCAGGFCTETCRLKEGDFLFIEAETVQSII